MIRYLRAAALCAVAWAAAAAAGAQAPNYACANGQQCSAAGVVVVGFTNQTLSAAVPVTTSPTPIVAARTGRGLLILVNDSSTDAWCGPTNGVAVGSGTLLAGGKGNSITLPYAGAEDCISTSGTLLVSVTELY